MLPKFHDPFPVRASVTSFKKKWDEKHSTYLYCRGRRRGVGYPVPDMQISGPNCTETDILNVANRTCYYPQGVQLFPFARNSKLCLFAFCSSSYAVQPVLLDWKAKGTVMGGQQVCNQACRLCNGGGMTVTAQ